MNTEKYKKIDQFIAEYRAPLIFFERIKPGNILEKK